MTAAVFVTMPDAPSSPPPDAGAVNGAEELRDRADLDRVWSVIGGALERLGYTRAAVFAVRLALEEAVSNAFHHGHRALPPGTPVRLDYAVYKDRVEVAVEDRGPGFSPDAVPDPTLDQNLENPSGRGIMLMRAYMTRVEYSGRGNRVSMLFNRPPARPSPAPRASA